MTTPKRDDTAAYYPTPHWETNETTHTVQSSPVLFVSGATVKASDFFLMDVKGSIPSVNLVAKGVATGGETTLKLLGTAGYSGGATWSVTATADQSLPANKVDCYKPMHIDWRIAFEGSSEFAEAGENTNHVYVSWHAPTTGNLFHTVVDVACRNAKGKTTESDIVAGIWNDFAGPIPGVNTWDGVPMSYWAGGVATATTTADLAKDRNGQCGSWANLLMDTFLVHGIGGSQKIYLTPQYSNDANTEDPGNDQGLGEFLIKNWSFTDPGTAPTLFDPFTHRNNEISPQDGAGGQNNENPPESFRNHYIVSYDGKYFDPSYGNGPFTTKEAWEDASIDGFRKLFINPVFGATDTIRAAKRNTTGLETRFIPQ